MMEEVTGNKKNGAIHLLVPRMFERVSGMISGFTTRGGGVSPSPWDSLNLSSDVQDRHENVMENRSRLLAHLNWRGDLVVPRQVHGSFVTALDSCPSGSIEADGLIGNQEGILLGILVADCVPILMADKKGRAFGCIHAGWRGTAQGIIYQALETLLDLAKCSPREVLVSIGPSIGPCCYEVDTPVLQALNNACPGGIAPSRYVDLQAINYRQLVDAGLEGKHIEMIRICTSCDPGTCFSFRRDRGQTGRMLGFIGKVS